MKKKYGFSKKKPKISSDLALTSLVDNVLDSDDLPYEEEFVEEVIVEESETKQDSIFSKLFQREKESPGHEKEKFELDNSGEEFSMEEIKHDDLRDSKGHPTAQDTTSISNGFIIRGHIESSDSIVLSGTIEGNVTSSNSIDLREGSAITGNVKASSLNAKGGHIEGDVEVGEHLELDAKSAIIGAVQAESAHISGRVEGPITVKGAVIITSTAQINGNLSASSVVVESGAQLFGSYTVTPSKKTVQTPVYETKRVEPETDIELN